MKLITVSIGVAWLFAMAVTSAFAQEQAPSQQERSMQSLASTVRKATVQDIDYQNRTVTLKGERGNIFTIQVGDEVKNFNQIKKGDYVTARYTELMAVGIRKLNEPPTSSRQETLATAPPGEKPAATTIQTSQMSATVDNVDRDNREVTLRGAGGDTIRLKVGKNVKGFDSLKKGDQVVATYTEEFTVAVTSPQE